MQNRLAVAALAAAASLISLSSAQADTILPFNAGGFTSIFNYSTAAQTTTPLVNLGPDLGASVHDEITGHSAATASVTSVSKFNGPTVSAGVTSDGSGVINAEADLTYYFQLVPPEPHASGVNVIADGSYLVSQDMGLNNFGKADVQISACGSADCGTSSLLYSLFVGPGFAIDGNNNNVPSTYQTNFEVDPDVTYKIVLSALASISNAGSASAMIDPTLTIDPSAPGAAGYKLAFSSGLATTPIPAALPLFTTGIGALSFIGWRRKRERATA